MGVVLWGWAVTAVGMSGFPVGVGTDGVWFVDFGPDFFGDRKAWAGLVDRVLLDAGVVEEFGQFRYNWSVAPGEFVGDRRFPAFAQLRAIAVESESLSAAASAAVDSLLRRSEEAASGPERSVGGQKRRDEAISRLRNGFVRKAERARFWSLGGVLLLLAVSGLVDPEDEFNKLFSENYDSWESGVWADLVSRRNVLDELGRELPKFVRVTAGL